METADTPTLILSNLPPSALAGIDLLSFTTTPRFQGVKNLTPGFHFTYVGSSTAFSERHGVWFRIPDPDGTHLVVAKWDGKIETLVPEADPTELLRWRANLGGIWQKGLTPYRQTTATTTAGSSRASGAGEADETEELFDWAKLTSHISQPLLSRICGGGDSDSDSDSSGGKGGPDETASPSCTLSSASSALRDLEPIPGLTSQDTELHANEQLHFLPVDLQQTWREGATGRERTEAAQDRSWALRDLIEKHGGGRSGGDGGASTGGRGGGGGEAVIGELQFCFLMVLTLNNFSCLEQWRRLLTLLFTCRTAVATHASLFVQAIGTLRLQLQHCKVADNGLIELADEGGSVLRQLLVRFRRGVEGLSQGSGGSSSISSGMGVQDVVDELDDLEEYLRQEHGWAFGGSFVKSGVLELEDGEQVRMDTTAYDEDDETGEYAPQIVDLTPEQARLLNVGGAEELHHGLSKASLREVESSESDGDADDRDSEEDEYEVQDLEDMDSRY